MKTITISTIAAGVAMSCCSAFASLPGLTLCQVNNPDQIQIICNDTRSPAPIPGGADGSHHCASIGSGSNGDPSLPWAAIKLVILQGQSEGTCIFKDGSKIVGQAQIDIKGSKPSSMVGEVSNITNIDQSYNVSVSNEGNFVPNIQTLITHK